MKGQVQANGLTICIVCFFWYNFSISANIVVKKLMNDFPYPVTITIVQLFATLIYLKPYFKVFNIPYATNKLLISKRTFILSICPLALGKFISTACAHMSISKVSISYAHTIKATMPLFTIILGRIFMNEKQNVQIYASLVPIILGVILASMTEMSFDAFGLYFALMSTLVFATMNIFSKKLLNEKRIHHLSLLYMLSSVAVILFIPVWIYTDYPGLKSDWPRIINDREKMHTILLYLLLNSIFNFGQNMLAFTLLSMIAPLSYSIANVTKRIWVISLSLFFMGNQTSVLNVLGMAMAIFGIFLYHRAKYLSRLSEKSGLSKNYANGSILPMHYEAGPYQANFENGAYNNLYNSINGYNNGNVKSHKQHPPSHNILFDNYQTVPASYNFGFNGTHLGDNNRMNYNSSYTTQNVQNNSFEYPMGSTELRRLTHNSAMGASEINDKNYPSNAFNNDQMQLTSVLSQGYLTEI